MAFGYFPIEDNLAVQGTLLTPNPVAGLPIRNCQILPVGRPGHINKTADQLLSLNLPVTENVDFVALVNHNLSSTATVNLNGGNSPSPDGSTFQQAMTWRRRDMYVLLGSAKSYQHWALEIDDPANLHGFISVGYLVFGVLTQPSFGFQYGWRRTKRFEGVRHRTDYGTPLVAELFDQSNIDFTFGPLDQSDADTLSDIIHDTHGDEHPMIVVPDVTDPECYFGRWSMQEVQTRNFKTYMPVGFTEDGPGRIAVAAAPFIYEASNPDQTVDDLSGTFSRASTGYYVANTSGNNFLLVAGASGAVRENHIAAPDIIRTLLLEDTRTNDWNYSEEFDQSGDWTVTRATVSPDATTAPDGTATADKLVEDGTASNSHYVAQTLPTLTDDTDQAVLVYAAPAERTWISIATVNKAGATDRSWVDLTNGVTGTVDASHTVTVRSVANGFTEIRVIWNCSNGGTTPVVRFQLSDADNSFAYNGDSSSGLYIWGAQFETDAGSGASAGFGSSYIKTTSAAATREPDLLVFPYTETPKALTVYARFVEKGTALMTGFQRIVNIGATAEPTLFMASQAAQDRYYIQFEDGNGNTSTSSHGTDASPGDLVELRGVLYEDGSVQIYQTLNGGSEVSASAGTAYSIPSAWSSEELTIGDRPAADRTGFNAFSAVKVARGVQTLQTMRDMVHPLSPAW